MKASPPGDFGGAAQTATCRRKSASRKNNVLVCRRYYGKTPLLLLVSTWSNPVYSFPSSVHCITPHPCSFVRFTAQSCRTITKLSADRCSWVCLAAQRENAFNFAVRPPFHYASTVSRAHSRDLSTSSVVAVWGQAELSLSCRTTPRRGQIGCIGVKA